VGFVKQDSAFDFVVLLCFVDLLVAAGTAGRQDQQF